MNDIKFKTKLKLVQSRRFFVEKNPYYTTEQAHAYSIRCELHGAGWKDEDGDSDILWLRRNGDALEFVRTNGYGGKGAMVWSKDGDNNASFLQACEFLTKMQQRAGW